MKTHKSGRYSRFLPALLTCGLLLSLFVVTEVEAQGLKKLRTVIGKVEDKVQEKTTDVIENYIESKISQETEKALNKWFGFGGMQQSQSTRGGMSGAQGGYGFGAFGMDPNAQTESVYEFDYKLSYFIESVEKGKSTKFRMITYLNSGSPYYAIQMIEIDGTAGSASGSAEAYMIMDEKNNVMAMLVNENGQQSSIVFSLADTGMDGLVAGDSGMAEEYYTAAAETDLVAGFNAMYGYESIGSRTISGFDANGFRTQEGRSKIDIWVTNESIKGYKEMQSASASVPMMAMFAPYASTGGMLVEMTANDEASDVKTTMRLEDGSGPHKHNIMMSQWPRLSF
jgi:hypothetical protein